MRNLTSQEVAAVRRLHAERTANSPKRPVHTTRTLARVFKVSSATISRWLTSKHLPRDAALIEHLREHGRGAISRMKEEVQRRPVVARRGPAIGAAEDDRRLILAEVEVGEERDKGATVARDAAEMEGVVPRIVAVREPFGVAHDGRNGRGLAH